MSRELTYVEAINEATRQSMAQDSSVYLMGLGAPDPKGIFGTTAGLQEEFGEARVMDMPTSENAMTGIAIGSALDGLRPIMTHQRIDFAILAMEQIVNQAAKWHYMFGGLKSVPLVIRLIIGRGWGQGPQHSQSFQSWFAHVPGLKVVMPTTPYDAKGLVASSIQDNNPVIVLEHRWLYGIRGEVPEELYTIPIGTSRTMREGSDVTIVGISHMSLEALRAAEMLEECGVSAEVIDLRSLKPIDEAHIVASAQKTGRLVVADTSWKAVGMASEIITFVTEKSFQHLKSAPRRVGLPDCPTPTSPTLAAPFYPRAIDIANEVRSMLSVGEPLVDTTTAPLDIPDKSFTGPF